MPTPKLRVQEQKSPKSEHSIIFRNTSAKVSPHLWNKSSYQILRQNRRAVHCASPLLILSSWEHRLLITLDCLPGQSFHNSTANFRVHTSVTFLVNGDERPLLMVCFLKRLETSPCRWRWFCRRTINRLCHAFPRTQNIFTNGALIPKTYSTCSFADAMFSSGNFRETLVLHRVFRARAEHFQEQICIFLSFAHAQCVQSGFSKFRHKTLATLGENQKGEWQNLELLRGYPYFDDFPEQIQPQR